MKKQEIRVIKPPKIAVIRMPLHCAKKMTSGDKIKAVEVEKAPIKTNR